MVASLCFQNLLDNFSLIHTLERVPYCSVNFQCVENSLGQAPENAFLTVSLKPYAVIICSLFQHNKLNKPLCFCEKRSMSGRWL